MFLHGGASFKAKMLHAQSEEEIFSHPWAHFKRVVFGIVPRTAGLPGSRLIHPSSNFSRANALISTFFLMYTALVVPVVIGFKWDEEDPCWRNPLVEFDVVVDSFFILNIFLSFVTGIQEKSRYHDDIKFVSKQYAKHSLMLDLAGSIPVSYIELYALSRCQTDNDDNLTKFQRLVRFLRILRLARVVKAMRQVDISTFLERLLHISPIFARLLRVFFTIVSVMHCTACLFWLVKVEASDRDTVREFLVGQGLDPEPSLTAKYILSVYFVQAVFSTVGFGDISASNTYEQLLCIGIMLLGVIIFGALLAEVQAGLGEMRFFARQKNMFMGRLKNFLRQKDVSIELERKILEWVDFTFTVQQQETRMDDAVRFLNPSLRRRLDEHVLEEQLSNVDFLNVSHALEKELQCELYAQATPAHLGTHEHHRPSYCHRPPILPPLIPTFLLLLLLLLIILLLLMLLRLVFLLTLLLLLLLLRVFPQEFFAKGAVVMDSSHDGSFMLVIERGIVRVKDEEGCNVAVLGRGDCLAEWSLLGVTDNNIHYGFPVVYIAEEHTHCVKITKRQFERVLRSFPPALQDMVKHRKDFCYTSQRTMSDGTPMERKHMIAVHRWFHFVSKATAKERHKQHRHDATTDFFHGLSSVQEQAVHRSERARRPSEEGRRRVTASSGSDKGGHRLAQHKPPFSTDLSSDTSPIAAITEDISYHPPSPWNNRKPSSDSITVDAEDFVNNSHDHGHGHGDRHGDGDGRTRPGPAEGGNREGEMAAMQANVARLGSEMAKLRGEVGRLNAGVETILSLLTEERRPRQPSSPRATLGIISLAPPM